MILRIKVQLIIKINIFLVINQFAERAERIVNKLERTDEDEEGDRDIDADVDEIIEASELVHNAVKEIRNALLMNRNPEDVDSDNEYEDGSFTHRMVCS